MPLVHSFVTYLHSLFLEARIWVGIWKTSLLVFNYILHFCRLALLYTISSFQCPVSSNDFEPVNSIPTVA